MQLQFTVKEQTIFYHRHGPVVADSQGYLTAAFTFSSDWNDVDKYARFTRSYPVYNVQIKADGTCVVPWEVLIGTGEFSVTVFGVNKDNAANKLITANKVKVMVDASGLTEAKDRKSVV